MTKIQVNLSEKEDKIVEIYKLVNDLKTKEEAIKKMISKFNVNAAVNLAEKNYKQAIKFSEDKK
jgi:flavoprotein